ncbi:MULTISPECIES: ABC transporter permease [unclassified Pseudomonas]|uniref:ABC transporter permease n=1 Tax=unclassified Pseudomonas TaxID=196821 RepID=UPI001CE16B3E|nr:MULTISPECIES: ABC transporter permease [unclassified Pseudomonas]
MPGLVVSGTGSSGWACDRIRLHALGYARRHPFHRSPSINLPQIPLGPLQARELRRALYTGMIPTLNQMAAAGIITLPGIMTGQILAGMDPLDATRYQILLMFLLAAAGFATALGAVWLSA